MCSPQYLTPDQCGIAAFRLSFLSQFGRLIAILPPCLWNSAEIAGFAGRTIENIPIGDPVRRFVPMRDPVSSGADDAIKRLAGGREVRAGLGSNNSVNKCVHRWIGDASPVL